MSSWWRKLFVTGKRSVPNTPRAQPSWRRGTRLAVEILEDRLTPSAWTVNSAASGVAGAANAGTLAYCVNQADADTSPATITFAAADFGIATTITLTATLTLSNASQPITIDASTVPGPITVSGNHAVSDFIINSGVTATIKNLTISAGSAGIHGGAIANEGGTVTLSGCTLSGNTATTSGGAVQNDTTTSTISLTNCTLSGNSSAQGGAIDATGTITLNDCTVQNNTAGGNGGGIDVGGAATLFVQNSSAISGNSAATGGGISQDLYLGTSPTSTIDNSTLTGNTATTGGGIAVNSGSATIQNGSMIQNNAAGDSGGGILNAGTTTVTGSTISANSTTVANFNGGGGGIATSSILTLVSTNLTNNLTDAGGVGYGGGGIWISGGSITADSCTISGNKQTFGLNAGGALQSADSATPYTITFANCTISGNSATQLGGALNLVNSIVTIDDTKIQNNTAGGGKGGGINCSGPTLIIKDGSLISGNTIGGSGGGIYASPFNGFTPTVTIDNSTVSGNTASSGGGIDLGGGTLIVQDNSQVLNNTTSGNGGGIADSGTITVANSTISGNSAPTGRGGGVYIAAGGSLTISSSTIADNSADPPAASLDSGGGIWDGGTLFADDCLFSGNSAGQAGAGLEVNVGSTEPAAVTDCTFSGNVAVYNGAGISGTGMTVSDCTFSGNTVTGSNAGGAGIAAGGTFTVVNSTFSGNTAAASGGAIEMDGGTGYITNSTISGNTSSTSAGGVYIPSGVTLTLNNTVIAGNSAPTDPDIDSANTSGFDNFIGNGTGLTGISSSDGNDNHVGTAAAPLNPLLLPLGNYGGPTQTMLPAYDSPLAGDPAGFATGSVGTLLTPLTANSPSSLTLSAPAPDALCQTPGMQMVLQIDAEDILVSYASGSTFNILQRGYDGTIAAAEPGLQDVFLAQDQTGKDMAYLRAIGSVNPERIIYVTTTSDAASHTGTSLRDAVTQADSDAGLSGFADTIEFLSSLDGQTITLTQGPLSLSTSGSNGFITIDGAGQITISGNGASAVFQVGNATAVLTGLTIKDGDSSTGGGGISNAGTLTLNNSSLIGNTAANGYGGAIDNTGTMTVNNSQIVDNVSSGGYGGGIYNKAVMTLTDTVVSASTCNGGPEFYNAGGIFNDAAGSMVISGCTLSANVNNGTSNTGEGGAVNNVGTLTVINSTISGNTSSDGGGGIGNSGSLTVINCCVYGNSALSSAAGLYTISYTGAATMTVINSTITANSAPSGGGIIDSGATVVVSDCTVASNSVAASSGGGVLVMSGSMTLLSDIVSGNTGGDVDGTVAGSYNFIGNGTGMSGISNGDANHNQVGAIPSLGALSNAGGPTMTMPLTSGSPAINTGGPLTTLSAAMLATDTTLTVATPLALASSPVNGLVIQIDSEQMLVDYTSGSTFTIVQRGYNATIAAAHSNGAGVFLADYQNGLARVSSGVSDVGASGVVGNEIVKQIAFVSQPPSTTAGTNFAVTVSASDQLGDPMADAVITLTSSGSVLNGGLTGTTNSAGQAVFSGLAIDSIGTYSLTASTLNTASVNSSNFTISLAPLYQQWFATEPPTSAYTGSTFSPVVQVVDPYGNLETGSAVSVALSGGTLVGPTSATTNATGQATFSNLSISTVGTCTLTASASGIASIASNAIAITSNTVASLQFVTQPTGTTGGSSLGSVTVLADNASDSPVVGAIVTMSMASGTLNGTLTATTNASGDAIFSGLSVDQVGTCTLTATSAPASQTSSSFVITVGAANTVTYVSQPSSTTAGLALIPVTVQVADAFGNVISGAAVSIALTAGTLTSGAAPLTTNAAGQVVFSSLVEDMAGTYTLSATVASLAAVLSSPFTISSAAASTLSFVTSPSNSAAGSVINPVTVRVVDTFGNPVPGVGIGIAIPPGSLSSGTTPLTSNAAGQVVFSNLIEDTAGTYSLAASATGLPSVSSGSFVIAAAAASKISYLTQPLGTSAGVVISAVTVQVADKFRNVVSGAAVSITLAPGSLSSGTTSVVTNGSGQAVFGNLVEDTAGTYTLTATTAGVAGVASNSFIISAAAAAKLTYVSQPSSAVAGSVLNAVTLQATDSFGNAVAGTVVGIALSSGSFNAGTTSLTSNAAGQVVFSNLVEDKAGTYTLTASASGVANVGSNSFTITPQVSSEALAYITEPLGTTAGSALAAVTIQAADQFGNVIAGVSVGVSLSPHPLTSGTTPISTNAAGQAVFSDLVENTIGTYTLTASAAGAASIASNAFIITPSAATAVLSFLSQPGNVIAGNDISAVTVKVADKFGNVIAGLPISIGIAPGTLTSGTTPLTSNASGQVVFGDLLEDKAGTYSLTASLTGLASIVSGSFVVSPSAATAVLSFARQPNSTTTAGTVLGNVIVQATDTFGNVVPGIVVGVAMAPGTLSAGTTSLTTNALGQAGFSNLIEDIAGSYALTATASGLSSVSSNPFTITAAAAAKLSFVSQPSTTAAGTTLNTVIVQAGDKFGNAVAGVVVGIASSPKPLSTGTTPLMTGVSGQADFADLSQNTVGTYTLTASAAGLASVASQSFVITSAAAQSLTFVNQPSSIAVGSALNAITLSALDRFGNLVVGGSVSLAMSSGTLNGTTTAVTNGAGQAIFSSLSISTGGLFTLKGTSGAASATSNPFAVTSAADTITWVVEPTGTIAGAALSAVTVSLSDPLGDLLPGVKISVALSSGALTSGTTTATTNGSGQATFSGLTLNTLGTFTLSASATPVAPSASSSFVITSANVSKFTFMTQPSTTVAGAAMTAITVKAVDQFGNVVAGLPISLSTNYGALSGATSATTNAAGLAVFSGIEESLAGTCVLTANVTAGASGSSTPITVTSATASTITFVTQPAGTRAGTILSPVVVKVADRFGNAVAGTTVTLQISANSVNGSTVLMTNSAGEAVFSSLVVTRAGTYTFSALASGLTKTTSNPFTITAGAGVLSYLNQPAGTSAGSALNPVTIRVLDQYGNPVVGVSVSVRLATGTLSGTTTVATTSAGQAVFTNLVVPQAETNDTLIVSSPGLASVNSSAFTITAAQPPHLGFTSPPVSTSAGATMSSVVVQLYNANGTPLLEADVPVTIKISTGTLTGTLTVFTNSSGQAVFSTLKVATNGTFTLTASATVNGQVVSVTSGSFTVS